MSSRKLNKQFLILRFFAIIFVVLGHTGVGYLQFNYITYYSFHMPLFMFISGYFLKESPSKGYYIKKVKKLVVPFILWNLVYLVIQTILSTRGYTLGNSLSWYNLFISPLRNAQPIGFNISSWFVITLIGVLIIDAIMRKTTRSFRQREWILLLLYFVLSVVSLHIRLGEYFPDKFINIVKILYMLPYFQLGRVYKLYWEHRDKIPIWGALFGIWLVFYSISLHFGNLDYGVFSLTLVANDGAHVFLSYFTAILGIIFWLKLSELLVPVIGNSNFVRSVAQSSYAIMMHHLFVIFLIQFLLRFFLREDPLFAAFNHEQFKSYLYYIYDFQKEVRLGYAISSIVLITYAMSIYKKLKSIAIASIGG